MRRLEELLAVERSRNAQLAQTLELVNQDKTGSDVTATTPTNRKRQSLGIRGSPNLSLNSSGLGQVIMKLIEGLGIILLNENEDFKVFFYWRCCIFMNDSEAFGSSIFY